MWRKWSVDFIALKISNFVWLRYGYLKIVRCSEDCIRIAKQAVHEIMVTHGTIPNQNGREVEISRKKVP
jgi:hypothetical protein